MSRPSLPRFSTFVERTNSCWLWRGVVHQNGYGYFSNKLAHRVAWRMHTGEELKGKFIRHSCGVRCCVRPDHLVVSTCRPRKVRTRAPVVLEHKWRGDTCSRCATHRSWPLAEMSCPFGRYPKSNQPLTPKSPQSTAVVMKEQVQVHG